MARALPITKLQITKSCHVICLYSFIVFVPSPVFIYLLILFSLFIQETVLFLKVICIYLFIFYLF